MAVFVVFEMTYGFQKGSGKNDFAVHEATLSDKALSVKYIIAFMRSNTAVSYAPQKTHEGGPADRISPYKELRRTVLACLLWESGFYETGDSTAARIAELCAKVEPQQIAALAVEARENMKLRHVPLFLAVQLSKHKGSGALVAATLESIIQRADELAEVLAMYWRDKPQKNGRRTGGAISHRGIKTGLAKAFGKFDEYHLAKYANRPSAVKLRDALFVCHGKPKDEAQADLWKRLIAGTLESPDTWEVELSAGKDKKATFERLLTEKKLGGMAVLRNLRNMQESGVPEDLIRERLEKGIERALPFRFITAARYAPQLEDSLEKGMLRAIEGLPKLQGKTGLLIDVSGSMDALLSAKGETTRIDAACGVGILARELCDQALIATFSDSVVEIPARRGFALRDAILQSQVHNGTYLSKAIVALHTRRAWQEVDRLIVVTDEQSADGIPTMVGGKPCYCINVATDKNGVSYSKGWQHLDGWSEHCLDYIREFEADSAE